MFVSRKKGPYDVSIKREREYLTFVSREVPYDVSIKRESTLHLCQESTLRCFYQEREYLTFESREYLKFVSFFSCHKHKVLTYTTLFVK
jgi:hypothetical protein